MPSHSVHSNPLSSPRWSHEFGEPQEETPPIKITDRELYSRLGNLEMHVRIIRTGQGIQQVLLWLLFFVVIMGLLGLGALLLMVLGAEPPVR